MFRSVLPRQLIRSYASAARPEAKASAKGSDAFLQNLLDKAQAIQTQSSQRPAIIKNLNNSQNGKRTGNKNKNNNAKSKSGNNSNTNQRRSSNYGQQKYIKRGENAQQNNQNFNKADHAQQRQARMKNRYGNHEQTELFDSVSKTQNSFRNRRQAAPAKSIFATKTGTRVSPLKKSRSKFVAKAGEKVEQVSKDSDRYLPEIPTLPKLAKFSSLLAFSPESRMTRALMQVLKNHYQTPELYSENADLLDQGMHMMVQQPISSYPFEERPPLSTSKIMGPSIVDIDFDYELLNKVIDRTVLGKFNDLKIETADSKLKLNALVVQNSLNSNVYFNYAGRKESIYKSCAGLEPVKSLLH